MRALLLLSAFLPWTVSIADESADKGNSTKADVVYNVGDVAPVFQARDDNNAVWSSADHVGKKILVVYFYPADLTGGCTRQACAFRDDSAQLEKAGVTVVGVSGDSPENHQLFRKMHALNFTLLADEDGTVAKTFGVPIREGATIMKTIDGVEKSLTRGVTAARWTYVIGLDGKILHKDTSVDAGADSRNILKVIEGLPASVGQLR
jgi:thioredoxin-dependent peroxiredoxin